MHITRRFEFSYAHHLPDTDSKCRNHHGHNGVLEVAVTGSIAESGPKVGMILDFHDLDRIVQEEVMVYMDHQDVNEVLGRGYTPMVKGEFEGAGIGSEIMGEGSEIIPSFEAVTGCKESTAEVMAGWIYARLARRMRLERKRLGIRIDLDLMLHSVTLWETSNSSVTVG